MRTVKSKPLETQSCIDEQKVDLSVSQLYTVSRADDSLPWVSKTATAKSLQRFRDAALLCAPACLVEL